MLQAMVAGLFGCLLLLVGACSAWHDSHHGERRAFSEPLPFHCSTYWTSFADLAPEWPDYLDSFKAELRHPRSSSRFSFLRGFHLFNKVLIFHHSQGGTWSPVPSSLCQAKTIRTEPGTSGILQVGFPSDLFQTRDDVFQRETGFPTIWTSSS